MAASISLPPSDISLLSLKFLVLWILQEWMVAGLIFRIAYGDMFKR